MNQLPNNMYKCKFVVNVQHELLDFFKVSRKHIPKDVLNLFIKYIF